MLVVMIFATYRNVVYTMFLIVIAIVVVALVLVTEYAFIVVVVVEISLYITWYKEKIYAKHTSCIYKCSKTMF